jgi:predicted PurR-regulated permease PerM
MVIALFALLMFLYDGRRIWRWIVGLVPAAS